MNYTHSRDLDHFPHTHSNKRGNTTKNDVVPFFLRVAQNTINLHTISFWYRRQKKRQTTKNDNHTLFSSSKVNQVLIFVIMKKAEITSEESRVLWWRWGKESRSKLADSMPQRKKTRLKDCLIKVNVFRLICVWVAVSNFPFLRKCSCDGVFFSVSGKWWWVKSFKWSLYSTDVETIAMAA